MPTFHELEWQGWTARAGAYDAYLGRVTSGAVESLLDATGVRTGMAVLDVACGPGYGAAGAAARGATPIGIDFAAAMVAEAHRKFSTIEFREGDGQNLPFEDAAFDAVICLFGLMHMPDPAKAIAEAYRVLRSHGRYGFTVWAAPDRNEFLNFIFQAIQSHGEIQVSLPPAPSFFQFSDAAECRRSLTAAGFVNVCVDEVPLRSCASSPDEILDLVYKSTVRTALFLEYQTPQARERINQAIISGAEQFRSNDTYWICWTAVLVTALKPAER
jgi:ubiquinone/menaquinone biosynthesis C-methylase UbiE